MTRLLPSIALATLLMTGGALAETSTAAQPQTSGTQAAASQDAPVNAKAFEQNLQKAGFKDIQFVNAAYVVQADTQSGQTVVMAFNPAEKPAGTTNGSGTSTAGSGTSAASSTSGQEQTQAVNKKELSQALEKSGFHNVKILSAAYVVNATTPDGQRVAMTISPLP